MQRAGPSSRGSPLLTKGKQAVPKGEIQQTTRFDTFEKKTAKLYREETTYYLTFEAIYMLNLFAGCTLRENLTSASKIDLR